MSEISEEATNLIDNFEYAVEDAVSDYTMACGASQKHQARRNLEDYIAELEAAQRWIPVSERLPEAYEKVIALAKDCMNVDWVLPKELREVGKGAFARLYNVTHWMPLPKLPEVQE